MILRARGAAVLPGLLCLLALGLQAMSSAAAPPGMHSEEELYNAAHALIVRDGGLGLAGPFRYQNECGGCAVVASLGSVVFSWVAPSIGAWRSIGLLFFALALVAGLALGWKVARYRGAGAVALVFAAAPPAYQRLAMVVNGNHTEGGALLLAEVALAVIAATARSTMARGLAFVLLLAASALAVPFLLSLQLGLILPLLVLVFAWASRWERLVLWPGLLAAGTWAGLLPYGRLLASMARRGAGSHESGDLVLSSSFVSRNLGTLLSSTQVRGIWGATDGPFGGRLGWLSFAALSALLVLGVAHCVRRFVRTRDLGIAGRAFLISATTVGAFVVLYLLYERQIGGGAGPPSPGQIRYLGLIYPTAMCTGALAAALVATGGGRVRQTALGLLLVALTLPGWGARLGDVRLLVTDGAQGVARYAPASAYGVDMIERLGVPLEQAPKVGRLDLAGMSAGRAAVRAGVAGPPISEERAKEAWAFGALRELMGPGFNSAKPAAQLLASLRPQDDGGPSQDILEALGAEEGRQGGSSSLDRLLLRNLWTFQRNTLELLHMSWDQKSLGALLVRQPSLNVDESIEQDPGAEEERDEWVLSAELDPFGLLYRVSAAGLGVEFGPLGRRTSDRLVVPPGAATLWKGPAPPDTLLDAWAWAWAWGLGAELGLRKGPGVLEVDLAVGLPGPSAPPSEYWPVIATALTQGFGEGYSYASWLDWVGPEGLPLPQVNATLFRDEGALYSFSSPHPSVEFRLPVFRPDIAPEIDSLGVELNDLVIGGNGLEWRDLRGASPRDFPGEVSFLGEVTGLPFCAGLGARYCVPKLGGQASCASSVAREEVGQPTAVSVPEGWMGGMERCGSPAVPLSDLPPELSRAVGFGAQLLVTPSKEAAPRGFRSGSEGQDVCYEEGLTRLTRGLRRLSRGIGRELYVQASVPNGEGDPGLELSELAANLVALPGTLAPARAHLLGAALRARGRRGVHAVAGPRSSVADFSQIARHLVWGGALELGGESLPGSLKDLLAFGAQHRDLVGLAEAPLGIVFSLTGWAEMPASRRSEVLSLSDVLLEGLARAGVPYELVVLGGESRGGDPVEVVGLALQRFDYLLLPQGAVSPAEMEALSSFAAAKSSQIGFVGSGPAPGSLVGGFERWDSAEDAVQFVRRAGLAVSSFSGQSSQDPGAAGAGVGASTTPAAPLLRISRHVVARDGGVGFHLVPGGAASVSVGLSIPQRLLPRTDFSWWFHHPGGSSEVVSEHFDVGAQAGEELRLPRFSHWGILEARPSPGRGGPPELKIVGSRERTVFVSVWDDPTDEELALIFPENLSPWPIDHGGFEWTVAPGGLSAEFSWPVRPVSVAGSLLLVGDRIDLEITFTNHSDETFSEVYSGLCLAPNAEQGFPGRFHERSWLVAPDGPHPLADLRVSSGASPLQVETNQFSWPVVIEESVGRDRSMAIAFDQASGVGGNAWGASVCLHIRPTLKLLEPGTSGSLRGAIYFVEGPLETAMARLEAEGWGGSTRRYGRVPDIESFNDGLPPRLPPACLQETQK